MMGFIPIRDSREHGDVDDSMIVSILDGLGSNSEDNKRDR